MEVLGEGRVAWGEGWRGCRVRGGRGDKARLWGASGDRTGAA